MNKKPYAFVLMPFDKKYDDTFTAIHNAAEAAEIGQKELKIDTIIEKA